MASSDKRKPLFLISPRLDATEYREKLMGSVVKYPDLPIERRIPYRNDKLPKDLVTSLDPKPVEVHSLQFWERNIDDTEVKMTLQNIVSAFLERAKETTSDNVATVARVWHMDSPGEKFKDLLRHKAYFDELFDLLQDNHGVGYFITDIVTFVNLEQTNTNGSSKGAGATAEVLDPTTGIHIGGSARVGVKREQGYSACHEGESIVFLGYRKIELVKVDGTRAALRRMLRGKKQGLAIKDQHDHWPDLVERPVPGNSGMPGFLGVKTPKTERADPMSAEEVEETEWQEKIAEELAFEPYVGTCRGSG